MYIPQGFAKGWAMSQSCLARQRSFQGNQEEDYTAVFYDDPPKLVGGILAGEVNYSPVQLLEILPL